MFYSYSASQQTLTQGQAIAFQNDTITSCSNVSHAGGSTTIVLKRPGEYLIGFDANITGTTAGETAITMYTNGVAYSGASSAITTVVDTDYTLGFTTGVKVLPNCCAVTSNNPVSLTFVTNLATTINSASIVVVKIK